jgi:23S rRNA G2445 N2-methylase RlmL
VQYKFAQKQDYSIYASGGVFYSLPGHPALPVRLASEIFQRCMAIRKREGLTKPCVLYDPCCGGAYHLSVLAYLHWEKIERIIGSDVDQEVLEVAARNLNLLTLTGINDRIAELSNLVERYEKASHQAALSHAQNLRNRLLKLVKSHPLKTELFRANATDKQTIKEHLKDEGVDMVISDVPYGQQTAWEALTSSQTVSEGQIWRMLEGFIGVLAEGAVVAIVADKKQRIGHNKYQRLERFQLGKRQVVLLRPHS